MKIRPQNIHVGLKVRYSDDFISDVRSVLDTPNVSACGWTLDDLMNMRGTLVAITDEPGLVLIREGLDDFDTMHVDNLEWDIDSEGE